MLALRMVSEPAAVRRAQRRHPGGGPALPSLGRKYRITSSTVTAPRLLGKPARSSLNAQERRNPVVPAVPLVGKSLGA